MKYFIVSGPTAKSNEKRRHVSTVHTCHSPDRHNPRASLTTRNLHASPVSLLKTMTILFNLASTTLAAAAAATTSAGPVAEEEEYYSSWSLFLVCMLLILSLLTSYYLQIKRIRAVHETLVSIVAGMFVGLIIRLAPGTMIREMLVSCVPYRRAGSGLVLVRRTA